MGYGFFVYYCRPLSAVGVGFGFGQIQLSRWRATLSLFKDYFPPYEEDGYNRHWLSVGWDAN